jgi:hypothetical protein
MNTPIFRSFLFVLPSMLITTASQAGCPLAEEIYVQPGADIGQARWVTDSGWVSDEPGFNGVRVEFRHVLLARPREKTRYLVCSYVFNRNEAFSMREPYKYIRSPITVSAPEEWTPNIDNNKDEYFCAVSPTTKCNFKFDEETNVRGSVE